MSISGISKPQRSLGIHSCNFCMVLKIGEFEKICWILFLSFLEWVFSYCAIHYNCLQKVCPLGYSYFPVSFSDKRNAEQIFYFYELLFYFLHALISYFLTLFLFGFLEVDKGQKACPEKYMAGIKLQIIKQIGCVRRLRFIRYKASAYTSKGPFSKPRGFLLLLAAVCDYAKDLNACFHILNKNENRML